MRAAFHRGRVLIPILSLVLFVFVGALIGCETNVSIIQDSDLVYSVQGILDLNARDQTIRVELLRDGRLLGSPRGFAAEATLRDLTAGQNIPVSFFRTPMDRGTVYNITTRPRDSLAYGHEYRLTVQGEEGTASVQVTAPNQPPTARVSSPLSVEGCPPLGDDVTVLTEDIEISVSNAQKMAAFTLEVNATGNRDNINGVYRFDRLANVQDDGDGRYSLTLDPQKVLVDISRQVRRFTLDPNPPPVIPYEFKVLYATAGPDWPGEEYLSATLETIAAPTSFSNVEGGVGLVGIVHRDTVTVPIDLTNTCSD